MIQMHSTTKHTLLPRMRKSLGRRLLGDKIFFNFFLFVQIGWLCNTRICIAKWLQAQFGSHRVRFFNARGQLFATHSTLIESFEKKQQKQKKIKQIVQMPSTRGSKRSSSEANLAANDAKAAAVTDSSKASTNGANVVSGENDLVKLQMQLWLDEFDLEGSFFDF
jgi:hypothetical protein